MTELLRILAALSMLYMHQFSQGAARFLPRRSTATPTVAVPTATPTIPPSATPTPTQVPTATVTAIPTATATPIPTATATAVQSVSDPTGFDVVGVPPAQKLPSAVLIYPLVRVSATQDTRVEMMNLTGGAVAVSCFYVSSGTCNEIGFFLNLTANQPLSWMASSGANGNGGHVAPPFLGEGELKCVVTPLGPFASTAMFNALQGRGIVSDTNGQTVGYSAIGFRRLSAGSYTGTVSLDGIQYEQCPDRLHFQVLTNQPGSDSEMVLVPCTEDLENQIPSGTNVLFAVINEYEQQFSGGTTLKCFNRVPFSSVPALRYSAVGTDTAHVIVRGTDVPVVGLVIDRFTIPGSGAVSASSNDPYLEGGRSAGIYLP